MTFVATAFDTPPPLSEDVAFEITASGLRHLPDASGGDRRLFEGWASLGGIDWQNEEILPDAFKKGAAEYLQKNPVLLWDHQRDKPIGRALSLTFSPEGVYLKGEILRYPLSPHRMEGSPSLALLCDEVWQSILLGTARGLSVRGAARSRQEAYSEGLGRVFRRVLEVLLYEISVTPIQVHPGAKIVAANTLAKALDLAKALPIGKNKMPDLQELQKAYIAGLKAHAEQNGGVVPDDVADVHLRVSKALQPAAPSSPVADEVKKGLDLEAENAELKAKLAAFEGKAAPSKKQETFHADPKAAVKPVGEVDGNLVLSKAIDLLSDPVKRAYYKLPLVSRDDIMGLVMARGSAAGRIRTSDPLRRLPGGISISKAGQDALEMAKAVIQQGKA